MPFCSRKDVAEQTPLVLAHFGRWGMEVHAGTVATERKPRKESKSEVLFCAAPRSCYSDPATYDGTDLSDVLMPGGLFVNIVDLFKYLGSLVSRNGSDAPDVDARISSASKAFGALSSCLFRSTAVTTAAKVTVYEGEILSILLYGCEAWLITERIMQRLRVFHAQCLRVMAGVSRAQTFTERISTHELSQQLGLASIETYTYRRQLRWLGHVSRMPFERAPRRMLTSWVAAKRPAGGQLMTYGRSVYKALDHFNINRATWPVLAANRTTWREAIHGALLVSGRAGRPKRAAAVTTNRRIQATLADARAGVWDIGASITHSLAQAALSDAQEAEAQEALSAAPTRKASPVLPPGSPPPLPPPPPQVPQLRRSARLNNLPGARGSVAFTNRPALPASLM